MFQSLYVDFNQPVNFTCFAQMYIYIQACKSSTWIAVIFLCNFVRHESLVCGTRHMFSTCKRGPASAFACFTASAPPIIKCTSIAASIAFNHNHHSHATIDCTRISLTDASQNTHQHTICVSSQIFFISFKNYRIYVHVNNGTRLTQITNSLLEIVETAAYFWPS